MPLETDGLFISKKSSNVATFFTGSDIFDIELGESLIINKFPSK